MARRALTGRLRGETPSGPTVTPVAPVTEPVVAPVPVTEPVLGTGNERYRGNLTGRPGYGQALPGQTGPQRQTYSHGSKVIRGEAAAAHAAKGTRPAGPVRERGTFTGKKWPAVTLDGGGVSKAPDPNKPLPGENWAGAQVWSPSKPQAGENWAGAQVWSPSKPSAGLSDYQMDLGVADAAIRVEDAVFTEKDLALSYGYGGTNPNQAAIDDRNARRADAKAQRGATRTKKK